MKTIPGYLTKNEAAAQLGVSRQTLDRHIKKRGLSTYQFVGSAVIYVQESDVQALLHPARKEN